VISFQCTQLYTHAPTFVQHWKSNTEHSVHFVSICIIWSHLSIYTIHMHNVLLYLLIFDEFSINPVATLTFTFSAVCPTETAS